MPASPVTPAQRQRLQKLWEEARGLIARANSNPTRKDAERIHELLSECVANDLSNTVYLDALLVHLRTLRRIPKSQWWFLRFRFFGISWAIDDELPGSDEISGILHGLSFVPDKSYPHYLQVLAQVCCMHECSDSEIRCLREALHVAPEDCTTLAKLARSLLSQGRFDESRNVAIRLKDVSGDSTDVKELLSVLDGPVAPVTSHGQELLRSESRHSAADFLSLAAEYVGLKQFDAAETAAAKALSLSGGDLAVREQVEGISLARLRNNVAIAHRLVKHEPSEAHQRTLRRWEEELARLELETLNARSERFPQAAGLKLEVAIRLKRAGNYSAAIHRLEEIPPSSPERPRALFELGECWQHLRQFDQGLDFYRLALAAVEESEELELLKLALYRAGCLAAAMKLADHARSWLQRLVALDPDFKDARERLQALETRR